MGNVIEDGEWKEDDVATRAEAEKAARDLLLATWTEDLGHCPLPVDPFEIATKLGLKVFVTRLEPDVSGMLAKRAQRDPEIYVNSADSENRRRFSCAHEIGHYDRRATGASDDSWGYIDRRGPAASTGIDPDEVYANQFAAELLMPEPAVKALASGSSPSALAVRFGVSLDAMKFRLENLSVAA